MQHFVIIGTPKKFLFFHAHQARKHLHGIHRRGMKSTFFNIYFNQYIQNKQCLSRKLEVTLEKIRGAKKNCSSPNGQASH